MPTYNERANIKNIIQALQVCFKQLKYDMHILVVDDNSPDGTAGIVTELQNTFANVHLSVGEKQGLGAAYIRGLNVAMRDLGADVVFEMDADFSHDPGDIPRLLGELVAGKDVVIGSRYIPGGSLPKNWGLHRRLISRGGNLAARYIAGIRFVKDCTAGFRAIRVSSLKTVDLDNLRVQGYAFQIALLHALIFSGARVKEIPVDFTDRQFGDSKLGMSDVVEFFLNVWWIRLQSSATFLKFGIVGASGVLVNIGIFTLLLSLGIGKFVASPVAIEVSIIWNFFLNNYWTFRGRNTNTKKRIKGLKFNLVSLISLTVSYGTFVAMSIMYPKIPPQISQFVGIIPATFVNYLLNSYWTFKHVGVAEVKATESVHHHDEDQFPSSKTED